MKIRYIEAFTLDEIAAENGKALTHQRVTNCTPLRVKYVPKSKRYIFLVRCTEKWSDPKGHIVSLLFDNKSVGSVNKTDVRIFCSCPAQLYWGSSYISTSSDYHLKEGTENRFPSIRDPGLKNTCCKHVLTVRKKVLQSIKMNGLRLRYRLKAVKKAEDIRKSTSKKHMCFEEYAVKYTLKSLESVPVEDCKQAVQSFLERSKMFGDFAQKDFIENLTSGNFEQKLSSVGMVV